jgi:hypothetical protein
MSALRAVVAARISQLTDESVSIRRQVKSGEAYALARQWPVAGYVRDEEGPAGFADQATATQRGPGPREP